MMMEPNVKQSYDGFQSERHETTQDIPNHVGVDSHNHHPGIQFHIKYPIQTLLSHFKTIFNHQGFKVTEIFHEKILITKLHLSDRLRQIFSSKSPPRYLLSINTQQYKSMRKVTIQPLFQRTNEHPQLRQFYSWIEEPPTLPVHQNNQEYDHQQDIYSLQATSIYMFHKIFVDCNYSLGKKMQKFIVQAHQLKESELIGCLNELSDDMLQSFNCTRNQLLAILCYCRKSVEDYFHNRTYIHESREEIDIKQSSIETELNQKNPLTVKCFLRLCSESNSIAILRQLFMVNFTFNYECDLNNYSEQERRANGKKLGYIFAKEIKAKTERLYQWNYSHVLFEQLLIPFG